MNNRFQQSNAFIPPIASDADLDLYIQEQIAVQEEIRLRVENRLTISELETHNEFLRTQMNQAADNQHSWRMAIERNMVSPAVRVGWTFGLGAGIYLKETLQASAAILGKFLFPVHFAIDGMRSLWDVYRLANEKVTAKRTQIGATLFHTSTLIAAATVVGLSITNPFALPIIFTGMSMAGIYKSLYVSRSLTKSIAAQANVITQLQTTLETLNAAPASILKNAEINTLTTGIHRQERALHALKEHRFQARREAGVNTVYQIAIGLLIGGIFFPPLAFAGMMLFASAGIANVIDWKTNNIVTRGIATLWNGATNSVSRAFNALRNTVSPQVAPMASPSASAAESLVSQHIVLPQPTVANPSPQTATVVPFAAKQENQSGFFAMRKHIKVPYAMGNEENEPLLEASSPSNSF